MMNKNQAVMVAGFCLAFIIAGVGNCQLRATQLTDGDTVDLAIQYTVAYPGHFAEIEVLMRNPVKISSFQIEIDLDGWYVADFTTDSIGIEGIWVPIDTCPDLDTVCTVDTCSCDYDTIPQPDTCPCMEYIEWAVRYCYIDTRGCLTHDFQTIMCRGEPGDTSSGSCRKVTVYGFAGIDTSGEFKYIEESTSYRCLFKLGVDLRCMCDSDTGRSAYFLISQAFSGFFDNFGYTVPFNYDPPGELFAWWSVPGDANNDGEVNVADIIFLMNYLFLGIGPPCIIEAGDPDSSCVIDVGDMIYLGNYLFAETSAPKRGCVPCPTSKQSERINEDMEPYKTINPEPLPETR
jgi:hypothetical protein